MSSGIGVKVTPQGLGQVFPSPKNLPISPASAPPPLSCARRVHFYTIVLLNGVGLMSIGMLLPDITAEFLGGPGVCAKESSDCDAARSSASFVTGVFSSLQAVVSMLLGPSLGALSDVHGRQFFVLLTQGANVLGACSMALHVFFGASLWLFFCVRVTGGLFLAALFAVVTDEVPQQGRAVAFAMMLAVFDLTMCIVPVLINFLKTDILIGVVCVISVLSMALSAAYGETLSGSKREAAAMNRSNSWRPDVAVRIINSNACFRHLSVIIFATSFVMGGIQQTFFFYIETVYDATKAEAGGFLAILALSGLFIQLVLLRPMLRFMGIVRVVIIGVSLLFIQYFLLVMSPSKGFLFVAMIFGGFGSSIFPCLTALKSALGSEAEQGRIQGAVSAIQSSAGAIAPVFYASVFSLLIGKHPLFGRSMPNVVYCVSLVVLLFSIPSALFLKNNLGAADPTAEKPSLLPKEAGENLKQQPGELSDPLLPDCEGA